MKIYLNEDNPRFQLEKDDFLKLARICVLRKCIPVCEMLANACNLAEYPKCPNALEHLFTILNDSQYEAVQVRNTHYLLDDWSPSEQWGPRPKYSDYRLQRSSLTRKVYIVWAKFPNLTTHFNLQLTANVQSILTAAEVTGNAEVKIDMTFNRPVSIDLFALMYKKVTHMGFDNRGVTVEKFFNGNWIQVQYKYIWYAAECSVRKDELTKNFAIHSSCDKFPKSRNWAFTINYYNSSKGDILSNFSMRLLSVDAERLPIGTNNDS